VREDQAITLTAKGSTDRLLAADQGERVQPMRGFEETYVDIVDYIVRVTHRIWEEKDIGYIYDTYRHNCRVTDDTGLQYARDKIVADTVHTINAFPDVRLYADEVIWSGDDSTGFSTSHRTVIVGHNTGHSRFGPPTGRKVVVWAIANCRAIENEIYEEWVLYNQSSLLRQLGFDLPALARRLGNERSWVEIDGGRFGEAERVAGQGKPARITAPPPEPFDPDAFTRYLLHQVWNWRNLSVVDRCYAPNVRYLGASDRQLYGRGELKSLILSFLAMFPDLALQVDDVSSMGGGAGECLCSVRWSIVGSHRGHGIYGPPTGRRVLIWGISQYDIRGGWIVQEWTLFNEFEVMQRLLSERG
jgi:predicted ester cyclase